MLGEDILLIVSPEECEEWKTCFQKSFKDELPRTFPSFSFLFLFRDEENYIPAYVGDEPYRRNGDSCAKTNYGNMLEQFLGNFLQIMNLLFKSSFFVHELFARSLMN
eukprot:sb/3477749/